MGGECEVSKTSRQGKYQEWITKEGLLKIEGWARDGLIDKEIAERIGVNERTFTRWKTDHPQIMSVLKKGKEVIDRQVENALLKRALGYMTTEIKKEILPDGSKKVTETVKEVAPDTTAQIFWLKNRKPSEWRDRPKVDDANDKPLEIVIKKKEDER